MSLPDQILASNAGSSFVNGIFTRGADIDGFAAWYSDRSNQLGVGVIRIQQGGPIGGGPDFGKYQIEIRDSALSYYKSVASITPLESPVGLTYILGGSGTGSVPTISAVGSSEPTFGLPAGVVAQMVAAHGSVANFLRLRNQGYI